MSKKRLIFVWVFGILVFLFTTYISYVLTQQYSSKEARIFVFSDKYTDYCFMNFTLTPDNTVLILKSDFLPDFLFSFLKKFITPEFLDGFFTIYIPRNKFPILAGNNNQYISIIMPKTNSDILQKNKFVAKKKALFDKIVNMVNSGCGQVEIVLDLSQYYMRVKEKVPFILKLEGSIVYFREVNGMYIDHVEP